MAQKQINLKVDSQLFAHLCKKSQRNNMSNPEFIRHLLEDDMKKPSEGDKEMLTRYGKWAAQATSKMVIEDIQGVVTLALKPPFEKNQQTLKEFIRSIDSSNKKLLNETSLLLREIRSLSLKQEQRGTAEKRSLKNQFTILYYALGGNLLVQFILFLKWWFA